MNFVHVYCRSTEKYKVTRLARDDGRWGESGNTRFLPAVGIDVNKQQASFIPRFARDDKTARFERK